MNERIKRLRKVLELTQQEFAERIGVKRNTIATYEIGRNQPIDAVITLICREFNVNEAWLRTGEGNMFANISRNDEIRGFVEQVLSEESNSFKVRFINMLSQLSIDDWVVLEKMALSLFESHKDNISLSKWKEIDSDVESYRQELIAEAKGVEKSSVLPPAKDA